MDTERDPRSLISRSFGFIQPSQLVGLYYITTFATKLPSSVLWNPAVWTPNIKGVIYGLPVATTLKLLWVFEIGRDVV